MDAYKSEVDGQFSVLCTEERGVAVVAAHGELDLGSVPRLRRTLKEVAAEGATRVVVDLSALSFMDSSGLGLVIEQRSALQVRGGQLLLVAPEDSTASRLLVMTELDGALRVHADRVSAVEEARKSGGGKR